MNEYKYKIQQARIKYPLKETILINPILPMMVDESGEELPESKMRNTIGLDKFLVRLEMTFKAENGLL
jgi:hypothetical protein|tara:strand:- start:160 stop:363 length:204 start_codon:yes stop_codon:yes gene_type:complete